MHLHRLRTNDIDTYRYWTFFSRDGTEIQYQIFSQIASFVPVLSNRSSSDDVSISIEFQHMFSTELINASKNERWEVRCGYADPTNFAYSWDIYTCSVEFIDDRTSTCLCSRFGSYVLMLILTQPEVTYDFYYTYSFTDNHKWYNHWENNKTWL